RRIDGACGRTRASGKYADPKADRLPAEPSALQACTNSARTIVASEVASAPRATSPPGNVTLNSGDDAAVATPTSTYLGDTAGLRAGAVSLPRRRSCTQCANVGYLTPSRRANAACDIPLRSYSSSNCSRL